MAAPVAETLRNSSGSRAMRGAEEGTTEDDATVSRCECQ